MTSRDQIAGLADLDALILDLGKIPADVTKELRTTLRRAAEPIKRDMQRRASWSTRIPGAIQIRTSLTASRPGVRIVVDSKKAPHARPWERGSKRNGPANLRHPVFADAERQTREEWTWVTERTRPFFFPAVEVGRPAVIAASSAAVLAAARSNGFT